MKPSSDHATCSTATDKKRILILGGGFGGIYAALELERTIARDADVEVMLVNRENFFLFTPMLHEIAASDLDPTNIVSPIRKLLKRVKFFAGDVASLDLEQRQAQLVHGSDGHAHNVSFDYLIMALGSVTNLSSPPGLSGRVMTMRTLGDAIHLRSRVIAALEEADTECAAGIRQKLLTFVVVGGGFAGVETIGAVNDFVHEALPYYPHIPKEQVRMVVVHAGEVILPELGEELGRYALKKLSAQGVEIVTECKVAAVGDETVTLTNGMTVQSRNIVWTAGNMPHPLVCTLPCTLEKGRVKVNEYLEVEGYANVWALGDCAVVPDLRTGKPHPPTAQHALREGRIAGRNVVAAIRGGRKRAFKFRMLGQLAAIGRRRGVARVFGLKFSGFIAWFLWRSIYLSKLPRFEKKLRVALDWTLDLFFSKDLVQYLTGRAPTIDAGDVPVAAPPRAPKREVAAAVM